MKPITVLIISVLVGALCFFVGMKYENYQSLQTRESAMNQFRNVRVGQTGGRMGTGGAQGFRPVMGEIISQDDKSITVKMQDNSSKIVILSEKTVYNKTSEATKNDLKVGEKVAVTGQENSDKSVTAQNIQLNPAYGRRQ